MFKSSIFAKKYKVDTLYMALNHVFITAQFAWNDQILKPPAGYQPVRTPARKLTATPTPMGMSGFRFQMEDNQVCVFDSLAM